MVKNADELTSELEAVGCRLFDERPEATALELDRIKQRAISQSSAGGGAWVPRKGLLMKPRIAVVFVLSLGLLMSGSGATLAVISDSGSAGRVQYPDLNETEGKEEVTRSIGGGDTGATPSVQEERQVASSGGGELPFTGFLAIPLLIAGVMLLVAGGVMRMRTGSSTDG